MRRVKRWHFALLVSALSCGGVDRVTQNTQASGQPSVTNPAPEPSTPALAAATSNDAPDASKAQADSPPQSLEACILEVLRNPFPGENIPADRFYASAVEALAGGSGDAEKLFSEAYLYTGTSTFVSLALFGHSEIERVKRDPIHWQFALGKYDRILAAKVVEPLRELALMRKAQTLAAVGRREAALAALAELDPRGKLGRCDASIRPLISRVLLGVVDDAPTLPAKACADALETARHLAAPTVLQRVGQRCQ